MTDFRFLHAADIHLDSPLKGLSKLEGSAAERIRQAPRQAFQQLVDLAIEEQVAFVILAGDLYDGDWRDYHTGLFFVAQMGRLYEAGIPVFLLYGNHDAESQITKRLELPDNVHIFSSRKPQTHQLDRLGVALHGQSFATRDVTVNLAALYPPPQPGFFNIGVLHTGLGGAGESGLGGHANYAPCSEAELATKGYAYWALGHVHQYTVLNQHPHIVFPGNLQGRHARETGPKGACLVEVAEGEVTNLRFVPCDTVRWAQIRLDVGGMSHYGEMLDAIRQRLQETVASDVAEGRLMACRIILHGRTALHETLMASENQLRADAQAIAAGLGNEIAWVEKLNIETGFPHSSEDLAVREDALGDLQRILADAPNDPDLLESLAAEWTRFKSQLPQEVKNDTEDGSLKAVLEDDVKKLIDELSPYLTSRLTATEE